MFIYTSYIEAANKRQAHDNIIHQVWASDQYKCIFMWQMSDDLCGKINLLNEQSMPRTGIDEHIEYFHSGEYTICNGQAKQMNISSKQVRRIVRVI